MENKKRKKIANGLIDTLHEWKNKIDLMKNEIEKLKNIIIEIENNLEELD